MASKLIIPIHQVMVPGAFGATAQSAREVLLSHVVVSSGAAYVGHTTLENVVLKHMGVIGDRQL